MESIDALGARPERIAAFTGDLLSETEDEELKAIARQAARDLSTPIALVNFVLEQIQFFKAQHGLPEDLVAARGTDRDVSFCQFVVRNGKPFEVADAQKDERVPKHLVNHYGIRSYLGMPIVANDVIVGSLCVIDTKPRAFSNEEREKLQQLTNLVNDRLALLAEKRKRTFPITKTKNLAVALEQLKRTLENIEGEVLPGRSETLAIGSLMRIVEHSLQSDTVPPEIIHRTLRSAKVAFTNFKDRLYDIQISTDDANTSLSILENIVMPVSTSVSEIVHAGIALSSGPLQSVGGYFLTPIDSGLQIAISKTSATTAMSACISALISEMMFYAINTGINIKVKKELDSAVAIGFTVENIGEFNYADAVQKIQQQLGETVDFNLKATEQEFKLIFPMLEK